MWVRTPISVDLTALSNYTPGITNPNELSLRSAALR
jgi:hypothetical protein